VYKKGGPSAAVEPTNQKVQGSSPSLCMAFKDTLPQTPHGAGSLWHWVHSFYICNVYTHKKAFG
jgi:hypothetical protein